MATTVVKGPSPKGGALPSHSEEVHQAVSRKRTAQNTLLGLGFLAPQLVGLICFLLGPLIFAIVLAFTDYNGLNSPKFVGLSNFDFVINDPQMRRSWANTALYTVISFPSLMIAGFISAYLMQKAGKLKSFYRVFFFAPQVTSTVAVAAIWLWLFNPEISPVNTILRGWGFAPPDWLQNPKTVILAFAIVALWQGLGYQLIMFMAGLENVPKSLMEAADIDGASELQKMRRITIPLLSPTILFLSITSIIGSFQVFDYIYVFLDTSAPAAARTVVYEIVNIAFREFNFGRASALAVILFVVLLAITGIQLLLQRRFVHYTE